MHIGPTELLSGTQVHLSTILETGLCKAAGASYSMRKSKCNCSSCIITCINVSRLHQKNYLNIYISSSLDIIINSDALQCSFLEFSYSSFEEEQLCCGAVFTTPLLLQQMETGNSRWSLFQCLHSFSLFNYIFHGCIFLLFSSALMNLHFLRGSSWIR